MSLLPWHCYHWGPRKPDYKGHKLHALETLQARSQDVHGQREEDPCELGGTYASGRGCCSSALSSCLPAGHRLNGSKSDYLCMTSLSREMLATHSLFRACPSFKECLRFSASCGVQVSFLGLSSRRGFSPLFVDILCSHRNKRVADVPHRPSATKTSKPDLRPSTHVQSPVDPFMESVP